MLQHWCNGAYKADLQMVALHQALCIFPQTLCKTDRLCWQVQGDKGPSEKSQELHPGVELPPLPTLSVTREGDTIPISHKGTEDQGPTAPQSSGVFFRLSQKLTNAHVKCLAWLMNDKKGVGKVGGGEEVTPSLPQLPPSPGFTAFKTQGFVHSGHCDIAPPSSLYHSVLSSPQLWKY